MAEEQIREEALLSSEEIHSLNLRIPGCGMNLFSEIAQAQLDKALKHKGIHIEAENQELPSNPNNYEDECREYTAYSRGQQDMLKEGWVKCLRKEAK
jgi:hypothetical protein